MFGWFKNEGKKVEELESSIKNSFQNMRTDMSQVSQWINHFKIQHDDHAKNFERLHARLAVLEDLLAAKQAVGTIEGKKVRLLEESEESSEEDAQQKPQMTQLIQEKPGIQLTDAQTNLYRILCSLVKENPEGWISMKSLAADAYSNKEYSEIRSAISQFVSILEVNGLVRRKRVGKETFVTVTKFVPLGKDKASIKSKVNKK